MKDEQKYFIVLFVIIIILLYFGSKNRSKKNKDNFTFPAQPRTTKSYNTSSGVDELPCSQTCGGGMRYRDVYCKTVDGTLVDNNFCLGDKPPTEESCNEQDCDQWIVGDWIVGDWTECSEECGQGTQTRDVSCPEGYICDENDIPANVQVCTGTNCDGPQLYTIDDFVKNNSQFMDWRDGTIYTMDDTWETELFENNWLFYNPTYDKTFLLGWMGTASLNVRIYDGYYSYENGSYPTVSTEFLMSVNNDNFPFATNGELFIEKGTYTFYYNRVTLHFW